MTKNKKEVYHACAECEELELPVKLGERETSVRFVERHWMDMKTVLDDYRE